MGDTECDDDDDEEGEVMDGISGKTGTWAGGEGWNMKSWMSVESAEMKSLRLSREFEKIKQEREERQLRTLYDQRKKKEAMKEGNRIRQQNMRDRKRTLRSQLDPTWVPGKKRVCDFFLLLVSENLKIYQKLVELEEFDTRASISVAELSRPRREFKEDRKKHNKPQGRKRQKTQEKSERTNWFSPFLWVHIEAAAVRAGKPWRPSEILRQARLMHPTLFESLTEQVIGRWIDPDAKKRGVSQWKDSVLDHVEAGNSPGGESTRTGALVRFHSFNDYTKPQFMVHVYRNLTQNYVTRSMTS